MNRRDERKAPDPSGAASTRGERIASAAGGRRRVRRAPRLRDANRTRARIVAAAHHEFAKRGLEGARVDEIARRAKINKQLLYYYFRNKEALYLRVLEKSYERFHMNYVHLNVNKLGPLRVIERLVTFMFDGTLADLEFVSLLRDENMHKASHLRRSESVQKIHTPVIEIVREALSEGEVTGVFRGGIDPLQFLLSMVGTVRFYFSNVYTLSVVFERDFLSAKELARRRRHCVDFIVSALRP